VTLRLWAQNLTSGPEPWTLITPVYALNLTPQVPNVKARLDNVRYVQESKLQRIRLSESRFEGPVGTTDNFFEEGYVSLEQMSRVSVTVPPAVCASPFVALQWTVLEVGARQLPPTPRQCAMTGVKDSGSGVST
jgi:hypothetical protein